MPRRLYRDRWPVGPQLTRDRTWLAVTTGDPVMCMYHAVLDPGEDLTETPPTLEVDAAEWQSTHQLYGLDASGQPIPGQAAVIGLDHLLDPAWGE